MLRFLLFVVVAICGLNCHGQLKVGGPAGLEEPSHLAKAIGANLRYTRNDPSSITTQRLLFNSFLINPARPYITKARLDREQVDAIREAASVRYEKFGTASQALQKTWSTLTRDEQASALAQLIQEDEEEVTKLLSVLSEILAPSQQSVLASAFLFVVGEEGCCDPIVRRWMGLSKSQAEQFIKREENAAKYLLETWKQLGQAPMTPLPPAEEEVYRRTKAMKWEGIEPDTIKKILISAGMLLEDEDLVEYVGRIAPKDGEALVKYIPAFSDAEKNEASVTKE